MKVICIRPSVSISTNGHPIGVEPIYINEGDIFDVHDEYLKERDDNIYTTNHTDGNYYSLYRKDFEIFTIEKYREQQINKIIG